MNAESPEPMDVCEDFRKVIFSERISSAMTARHRCCIANQPRRAGLGISVLFMAEFGRRKIIAESAKYFLPYSQNLQMSRQLPLSDTKTNQQRK